MLRIHQVVEPEFEPVFPATLLSWEPSLQPLLSFLWFLSITEMDLLLRIISNADIGDHMCHMIRDLGLAKFQLPLTSNCKSLCYDTRPPSGILAFSRQFNQRNYKASINPRTIFVSLGGISLFIFLRPSKNVFHSYSTTGFSRWGHALGYCPSSHHSTPYIK